MSICVYQPTAKCVFITAEDVIHAWWVPDFGIKRDAVPGMLNELWTIVEELHLSWSVHGAVRKRPRVHADCRRGYA